MAVAHRDVEVGQGGVTGEGVSAGRAVVLRALDRRVVCLGDVVVDDHERGAGVGDGGVADAVGLGLAVDGEGVGGELPEAGALVDGDGGERAALDVGGVDGAELVGAVAAHVQVDAEDGFREAGLDIVEEGLGLVRAHCEWGLVRVRERALGVNLPVLMLLKARPTRPSLFWSRTNEPETEVASSTTCCVTVAPPILTVSVPALPEADEPSPYLICQVSPLTDLKVELLDGSNAVCDPSSLEGSCVLKTQRSAEPVSKSRLRVWPPIDTASRYAESPDSGTASTSAVSPEPELPEPELPVEGDWDDWGTEDVSTGWEVADVVVGWEDGLAPNG